FIMDAVSTSLMGSRMRKVIVGGVVGVVTLAAVIVWWTTRATEGQTVVAGTNIAPAQSPEPSRVFEADFKPRLQSGAEPPFTDFKHLSATDADRWLKPDELILTLTLNGESRAYPINVLNNETRRKALNDTLGGEPILVTWCDMCQSAIVYSRRVEERVLS